MAQSKGPMDPLEAQKLALQRRTAQMNNQDANPQMVQQPRQIPGLLVQAGKKAFNPRPW